MIEKQKINSTLLQWCIYRSARQSATTRVEYNRELTDRQYKFINRPCGLDWSKTQIKIIDEDSAKSGASTEQPRWFTIITAEFALCQAGQILPIDVSKVARNNTDWYRLPDPCRLIEETPKTSSPTNSQPPSDAIAIIYHLLHAQKIMDALLCKFNSSEEEFKKTSKEKRKRAQTIGTMAHTTRVIQAPKDLENTDPSTKTRYHNRSGRPDQQNGLYRRPSPCRGGKP